MYITLGHIHYIEEMLRVDLFRMKTKCYHMPSGVVLAPFKHVLAGDNTYFPRYPYFSPATSGILGFSKTILSNNLPITSNSLRVKPAHALSYF